ncbi:helix-turn-helix transcriptional regulator [Aromatoleum tolulyticum]|uniref:helix-turn-helix transcriptional regulator n=1 Tax=Aromatoleum tolulyticum TaxID=34027 RepID=UPI001482F281|nr:helix-turn-helix domain-containing protein [Aromatoleum tolulyticum]
MQPIRFFGNVDAFCTSSGTAPAILVSNEAPVAGSTPPLRPGWRDVRDRIQEIETDPARRKRLIEARKRMAHVLSERGSLTFMRLERGMSKHDLAAMSAIPEAMLSRLEAGTEDPRLSVCCRLAQALNQSLDEIAAAIAASGPKRSGA